MTVTDPLNPSKFAADCKDIQIADAQASITFMLMKDGTPILNEIYNYDTTGSIRIGGLAKILSQTLYGELKTGEQTHASDTFLFMIDDTVYFRKNIHAMRLQNPRDPNGAKLVMAVAEKGICYPSAPLFVTVIGSATVVLSSSGRTIASTNIGSEGTVTTVDCDPAQLFPLQYGQGSRITIGSEIERTIIHKQCDDMVTVRFLNRYDMPECLTARYMTEKPAAQDDVSMMYGRKVRFDVRSSTEYTLASGKLNFAEQFDTWQDLLTSRKAQILFQGEWIDVIITKSNYTRHRRNFHSSQVEVSFQTANPYMTL